MFLRRIFKGMPELGPWVSVAELLAAMATVVGTLMALNVVHNPFSQQAAAGIVTGAVTDVRTGKAVPEATVQVVDSTSAVIAAESIPNAQGKWKETVKPGNYTVKAVCDGYAPSAKTVTVAASKERIVNLSITPETRAEEQARASGGTAAQPAAAPKVVVVAPPSGGAGAGAAASASTAPSDEQKAIVEFQRGVKLQSKDDDKGALQAFVKAAGLDPTDGKYVAAIIDTDIALNQGGDAKDWAEQADKLITKNRRAFEAAKLRAQ